MFKKIIASIVLASFIFVNAGVYFVNTVKAQEGSWYFQDYDDWHARVYNENNPDEIFGERYTAAQVEWVIYGIFAFILNHMVGNEGLITCILENRDNPVSFVLHCGDDIAAQIRDWVAEGLLSGVDSTSLTNTDLVIHENPISDILSGNRPISGVGYLRDSASKFNLVQEASAQGFGFEAASSIRQLWVAVRNVTYFFLILIIIAMSFMIMFRFKISPQTVITVQSALPKIIIALLLITFSYAIAGFMIDLLYVVIGIIAAVLSQSNLFVPPPASYTGSSWSYMYEALTGANFGQGIVGVMLLYMLLFIIIAFFALFSNITGLALFPATFIIWVILIIVAVIAVLIILLKVIWTLIKTFVMTLLLIAVGPIFIILGGFSGWLKNLASHLAVFAAIGPMLAIAMFFLGNALPDSWNNTTLLGVNLSGFISENIPFHPNITALSNSSWIPPFLPFGRDLDIVWLFASFVVITLIPNVANMIKSMIQGRPFGYGTAIGAALGAAVAVPGAFYGPQIGALRESWGKERASRIMTSISDSKYGQALKQFIGR